jgi:hypothetical protein
MSVAGALAYLGSQLVNPADAGPTPVTVDTLVPVLDDIAYRFSVIADVLDNADRQADASVTAATEAATQIEVIGQDVKDTTERIVQTILPHSMSWLSGYLVSHFITPLQSRMSAAESSISFLLGWRGQIDTWKNDYVNPHLADWIQFDDFFYAWPITILLTWQDWFNKPDGFAQWAAPPLIGPLVSYLAAPEHKQTRDNLASIMVKAWSEEADAVFDDMLTFLLAGT